MPCPTPHIIRNMSATCLSALLLLSGCALGSHTPIVGLPCEDCEVPLIGLPATAPTLAQLAPDTEPGERLQLSGRVSDVSGQPRAGVIIYAHQTNQDGLYPGEGSDPDTAIRRHGRLRAWAKTDADGNYGFSSVRPGSYPGTRMPQHIHLYVIERGCATYYIDDVLFRDDPHLTAAAVRKANQGRGGSGIVTLQRTAAGWRARRDIVLGQNIAGYPGCAK